MKRIRKILIFFFFLLLFLELLVQRYQLEAKELQFQEEKEEKELQNLQKEKEKEEVCLNQRNKDYNFNNKKSNKDSFYKAKKLTIEAFSKWNEPFQQGRKKSLKLLNKAIKTSFFSFDARHKLALYELNYGNFTNSIELWKTSLNILLKYHEEKGYDKLWDEMITESSFIHGTSTLDALSHKLRHDGEQLLYLSSLNITSNNLPLSLSSYKQLADNYFNVALKLQEIQPSLVRYGNEYGYAQLNNNTLINTLGNIWGTYWLQRNELNLPQLEQNENVLIKKTKEELNELKKQFKKDGVVVVDNVLTSHALQLAYEACLRAPMWHEVKPWAYLGAYPTSGLTDSHPVFLQIGKELPEIYDILFSFFDQTDIIQKELNKITIESQSNNKNKNNDNNIKSNEEIKQLKKKKKSISQMTSTHKELNMIWAYKYDNTPINELVEDTSDISESSSFLYSREGIGVHADDALLNINIWLTPDSANDDPQSGGLVIYHEAAPKEWNIRSGDRSADASDKTREMWYGRKNITVPYRQNRMVLFDSHRFHRTDSYRFKRGYRNRRINLTLLYGTRMLEFL